MTPQLHVGVDPSADGHHIVVQSPVQHLVGQEVESVRSIRERERDKMKRGEKLGLKFSLDTAQQKTQGVWNLVVSFGVLSLTSDKIITKRELYA